MISFGPDKLSAIAASPRQLVQPQWNPVDRSGFDPNQMFPEGIRGFRRGIQPQGNVQHTMPVAQEPVASNYSYNQNMFNAPRMRLSDLISQYRNA